MTEMENTRYRVKAKRKNSGESWSDWTSVDNYQVAVNHACHVEELGYLAKIVVRDKQVEELWDILGKNEYEKVDAILDAGFNKQGDVLRELILEIDALICCHANGTVDDKKLYRVFDKLKKRYLNLQCPDCKHFVGCECFDGRICDRFEMTEG